MNNHALKLWSWDCGIFVCRVNSREHRGYLVEEKMPVVFGAI